MVFILYLSVLEGFYNRVGDLLLVLWGAYLVAEVGCGVERIKNHSVDTLGTRVFLGTQTGVLCIQGRLLISYYLPGPKIF